MPQWRKLHVKATESLDINDMPDDFTRLLWVMLPLGVDREGRGLDNPGWIKAKTMPLRMDVTYEMIEAAMSWYASRGMIERYKVDGRGYFWIPSFHSYQNTEREAKSNFPTPPSLLDTESRVTQEQVASESRLDVEESREDVDVDAETQQPFAELSAAFATETKIPELTGGTQRWVEAIGDMVKAGVTVEDLQTGIRELRQKPKYKIAGPWSVINAAVIAMSNRLARDDPSASKTIKAELERQGYVIR